METSKHLTFTYYFLSYLVLSVMFILVLLA
jgi:hypothetical protein